MLMYQLITSVQVVINTDTMCYWYIRLYIVVYMAANICTMHYGLAKQDREYCVSYVIFQFIFIICFKIHYTIGQRPLCRPKKISKIIEYRRHL